MRSHLCHTTLQYPALHWDSLAFHAPQAAIALAAKHGHVEVVKLLVKAGVDLSGKDAEGKTAIDWAYSKWSEQEVAKDVQVAEALFNLLGDRVEKVDGKATE